MTDKFKSNEISKILANLIKSGEYGKYFFELNGKLKFSSHGIRSNLDVKIDFKNPVMEILAKKGGILEFSIEDTKGVRVSCAVARGKTELISKNKFWVVSGPDEIGIEFK